MEFLPSALAAIVAVAASAFVAWLNRRLGLDTATARYITSLEGLVKARDAEIADLHTQVNDLQFENRTLRGQVFDLARRLEKLEAK